MPTGTAANNSWEVRRYGEVNTYDGLAGVDTLSFERLPRSFFNITQNADGSVSVDSVAGASASYRLRLVNMEILAFSNGSDRLDLRTAFTPADTTAPSLSTATLNTDGTKVSLVFNETLDASRPPVPAAFSVRVDTTTVVPAAVSISGNTVTLTLPATVTVTTGQTVAVRYADPSASNDAAALQDAAGNDVASISDTVARNTSTVAPTPAPGLIVTGTAGRDVLIGSNAADQVDGGAGTDIFRLSQSLTAQTIAKAADGTITVAGPEGVDRLQNVERLSFPDATLAFDLDVSQSAGQAVLLIGAVLGKGLLPLKKDLMTVVIDLFDQGFSLPVLSGALMRLPIWGGVLTATDSSTDIAAYLFQRVHQRAPTTDELRTAVSTLESQPQGQLLASLAVSAANQVQVDLVGLQQSGFEFGPLPRGA